MSAAVIRGRITESGTGEPLGSGVVVIRALNIGTTADINGYYTLRNIPAGVHRVEVMLIGYHPDTSRITITSTDETVDLNVALRVNAARSQDVVITGRLMQETDAAARLTEKKSPTVVNVLSAESIQRSPDISAAEAVKRIPGISITRMRGEARQAIVRGMEGRYNNTLVDGIKIPSPLEGSRSINLDFMPSELLERVEVTKVLTPDMEADAIGGSVNFVMRNAPAEPFLRARLGMGYGSMLASNDFLGFTTDSIFDDPLERYGRGYHATTSDFPLENVKMTRSTALPDAMAEFTAGSRFLDNRLGLLLGGSVRQIYQLSEVVRNYESINADNDIYFVHSEWRLHSHSKTKYGLNAKADYVFDADNQIEASLVGLFRRNREARLLSDTGEVFVPTLFTLERTVFQQHTILSASVNGRHRFEPFTLTWLGGWAFAQQYKPDRAEVTTSNALQGDSIVSQRYFQTMDRDWQRNTDRDYFGKVDLSWNGLKDIGVTLSTGALARIKDRDNYMNAYRLIPIVDSVTGELPLYKGIDGLEFKVSNVGGTPEYSNNNYEASENVLAGYLQAEWQTGPWQLLTGARFEATRAEYSTHDVNLLTKVSAERQYADILPSLHLRYALDDFSNLRFSVGQSLSRPNYFDLVPYNYVGEDTRRQGNPNLKRTISTNADLRYELYPSIERSWEFSAGIYYKSIQDPIELALDLSNPSLPTHIPKNLGTATNYGVEVVAGVEFLRNFSLLANYTFTQSSITSDKIRFNRQTGVTETVADERSLQGQSEHVGNLTFRFSTPDNGTMVQAGLVFTGERVARVSPYPGLDHIQTDYLTFDLSAEQHIWNGISAFLHATNLLNTPYEIRVKTGELIESETFGRHLNIGFTYRARASGY